MPASQWLPWMRRSHGGQLSLFFIPQSRKVRFPSGSRSSFGTERDHRVDLGGATGGDEAGDQRDSGHDERRAEQRRDGQRRHIEENALQRSSGEPPAEQAKRAAGSEEAQP